MSSAKPTSGSGNKPPNKLGKETGSKGMNLKVLVIFTVVLILLTPTHLHWPQSVARKHPQPASTNEYRDIGSTNVPEGSRKGKNTKPAKSSENISQVNRNKVSLCDDPWNKVAHILYPVRLQSLTPLHLDDANNPES
jgi:hypothetical protein